MGELNARATPNIRLHHCLLKYPLLLQAIFIIDTNRKRRRRALVSGLKKPFAYYLKKNYDAIFREFNSKRKQYF